MSSVFADGMDLTPLALRQYEAICIASFQQEAHVKVVSRVGGGRAGEFESDHILNEVSFEELIRFSKKEIVYHAIGHHWLDAMSERRTSFARIVTPRQIQNINERRRDQRKDHQAWYDLRLP
jgi:hypothetical protein